MRVRSQAASASTMKNTTAPKPASRPVITAMPLVRNSSSVPWLEYTTARFSRLVRESPAAAPSSHRLRQRAAAASVRASPSSRYRSCIRCPKANTPTV